MIGIAGIRTWVHPGRREVVTYAEGDVIHGTCASEESYRTKIQFVCKFYGTSPAFVTLDSDGTRTESYQDRNELLGSRPEPEDP